MDKRYKDTDLREALHRKYADTPQLPADFMAKMEHRLDAKPVAKTRRLWAWLSAAACILIIIGIGLTMMPNDGEPTEPLLATKTEQPKQGALKVVQNQGVALLDSVQHHEPVPMIPSQRAESQQVKSQEPVSEGSKAVQQDAEPEALYEPNLHYASTDLTKDTIPYQDPARVDDFIAKLADNYNVKQGGLKCSESVESNVASTVYVFPDKKEIDVFGKLLQVACWYNSETPGYRLNFTNQQLFFELKDLRKQLQYRWIAERINGNILLYGTNAPIGVQASSTCFQEYRNELMHINCINTKNKKI